MTPEKSILLFKHSVMVAQKILNDMFRTRCITTTEYEEISSNLLFYVREKFKAGQK